MPRLLMERATARISRRSKPRTRSLFQGDVLIVFPLRSLCISRFRACARLSSKSKKTEKEFIKKHHSDLTFVHSAWIEWGFLEI